MTFIGLKYFYSKMIPPIINSFNLFTIHSENKSLIYWEERKRGYFSQAKLRKCKLTVLEKSGKGWYAKKRTKCRSLNKYNKRETIEDLIKS